MGVNFYRRDDRDLKFVLFEQMDIDRVLGYGAFGDFSREDLGLIIEEANKMAREVLGPVMQDGDRQGCVWSERGVKTPEAWKQCWRLMFEAGWPAASLSPEFGGQGLPNVVGGLIDEFFVGANMAFMSFPGLTTGNGELIEEYGTDQDRELFVEKMYTGVWGGTMCLTEPQAGSDVGALTTKAVPDPAADDPRIHRIEGNKRFISCGEHDLTENIIHLVLARLEGAPAGTKGLSLFIVPKIWVNPDGSLGEPNDVVCTGIEHKMGLHGSSTCSLSFGENGGCRGILLGRPNGGIAQMFKMMNHSRIICGRQATALTAAAYDAAREYAKERVQGERFGSRDGRRLALVEHEDVRRMLMNLKSGSEAMRAFLARLLFYSDVAGHDPDPAERQKAQERVDLLTPLVKAYHASLAFDFIKDAVHVFGGSGYCSDFPVEQYLRDVKIVDIWEGTHYIQSADLAGRKLGMRGGEVFREQIQEIANFAAAHADDQDFAPDCRLLGEATGMVGDFAARFAGYMGGEKTPLVPLYATRLLDSMAETVMAQLLLDQALIARERLAGVDPAGADAAFYRGKIASARYFCRNILTNVYGRHASLIQEDRTALEVPLESL